VRVLLEKGVGGFEFRLYPVDSCAVTPIFRALGGAFYGVFVRFFASFVAHSSPLRRGWLSGEPGAWLVSFSSLRFWHLIPRKWVPIEVC
jgi:hypothetical protein